MTVSGSHQAEPAPGATTGTTTSDDRSLGDILGAIANDLTTLVRQEIDLAKTEAKAEATKAGKGAGFLGGAGVTGHLALVFLSLTVMFILDMWMRIPWAALIVTVIWAVVAAVLASRGRKELKQLNPKLETTQRTLKEDAQWAKQQKSS
jgi:uncharacterized membrane protein YqjE